MRQQQGRRLGVNEVLRKTLYGRRQGRRLRADQRRLLEETLPKISIDLPEGDAPIDMAQLFKVVCEEYWLEIGFGGGEHLAWQAERQAENNGSVGIIGAEFFINGIVKLLRVVEGRKALEHLRVYQGDARDLMAALPEASISRIFILFPDPWPKVRHHKRRLIQAGTLDLISSLLRDNGELRMASDHPSYQKWMLLHMQDHPDFEWFAKRPDDRRARPGDWPATRYEEKALQADRHPLFLRFKRNARAQKR